MEDEKKVKKPKTKPKKPKAEPVRLIIEQGTFVLVFD
jgi:hypothetical protein